VSYFSFANNTFIYIYGCKLSTLIINIILVQVAVPTTSSIHSDVDITNVSDSETGNN